MSADFNIKHLLMVLSGATTGTFFITTSAIGLLYCNGAFAQTLPVGGQVVAGSATITAPHSNSLQIQQSSPKAIINWQGFSVGKEGEVNFSNGKGSTLNRVTGLGVSSIDGKLSASGSVYLLNPNGVIIGKSGKVNVGGNFVASTGRLSDEEFLKGQSLHIQNTSNAPVVNLGQIGSLGGDVALIGAKVDNQGSLSAPKGNVGLIAGHSVIIRDKTLNDGRFGVAIGGADTSVSHTGKIDAAMVELRAEGGNIYALAGNTKGVIRATGIKKEGGKIFLTAGDSGNVRIAGSTLQAKDTVGSGGKITVKGKNISVGSDALLDVSASAAKGHGGVVEVIANMQTGKLNAHGKITARGGSKGGNGGQVETSGASVNFNGVKVDTSAPSGATGQWLVDPYDLTVDSAAASTINTNLGSTNVTLQTTASGSTGPGSANANGNGDIFVNSALGWTSGNTLTLDAYRNININAPISAGSNGKVVLITGDTAGNGTSSNAAGNYSFGLGPAGFAGNLTFGTTPGSASLKIATGGGNTSPVSYGLIYGLSGATGLSSLNGSSGAYALANSIANAGAVSTSVVSNFGGSTSVHTGTFTGLGNTISGLAITAATNNAGLFGTLYGTVRDLGIINSTLANNAAARTYLGLLAGNASGATILNDYVGGASAVTGYLYTGGMIGQATNNSTIKNSFSTASVNTSSGTAGGLVGYLYNSGTTAATASTLTNSWSSGNVTASAGNYIGGLVGSMDGAGNTVSGSYATGTVGGLTTNNTGGLIGFVTNGRTGVPSVVSNSYATGNVSGNSNVGGLIGGANSFATISNSYATGAVKGLVSVGGLIGSASGGGTLSVGVDHSYATGNITASGNNGNGMGGLIGSMLNTAVNVSFASGNVTGDIFTSNVGGLVGYMASNGANSITDAYANGNVAGNSNVGGAIGFAASGLTTVSNLLATGTVTALGSNPSFIGAAIGNGNAGQYNNIYWDSTKGGTSGFGTVSNLTTLKYDGVSVATTGNPTITTGGKTTAQLKTPALPAGFNSGNATTDPNNSPWIGGQGLYPHFAFSPAPADAQTISGTGYTTTGAAAGAGRVNLYYNGILIASNIPTDAVSGFYSTYVGAGTITSGTGLGGTLALNGASNFSGASYTDTPTFTGNNVTSFDIKSGLFLQTTSTNTSSALNSALSSTFGSALPSISSTLLPGMLQINAANAFTVNTALNQTGGIGLNSGGDLAINAGLTTTGNIVLQSGGNISEGSGGALSATTLAILGADNVTLNGASNDVATLAATNTGNFSYLDSNALTIGTSGPLTTGIAAGSTGSINGTGTTTLSGAASTGGGTLSIATATGDLTVAQNVATSNTGANAITLNAGQISSSGTASGGNLVINGNPAITTGAGGTAKLYSGSAAAETSLATLIGSGSGRFRYNSDETTQNYTTALGSGLYAIYRQAINTAIAVGSQVTAYGTSPVFSSINNLVNGDSVQYLVNNPLFSSSGHYRVGSYSVSASAADLVALAGLGYTVSGNSNGTLTVNPLALTATASSTSKVYDATTAMNGLALGTSGVLSGDAVSLSGTGAFSQKNVGNNIGYTVSNLLLSGADAGNYTLSQGNSFSGNNGQITQAELTISTPDAVKTYDSTTAVTGGQAIVSGGQLFGTDSLSGGQFAYTNANAGNGNKTVTVGGVTVNDGNSGNNYAVTYVNNTSSTINKAALTVSTANVVKTYDGTTSVSGASGAVIGGQLFGSDSLSGGQFAYTNANAGIGNKTVTVSGVTVSDGNNGDNYAVTYVNNTSSTINKAALTISTPDVVKAYDATTSAGGASATVTSGQLFGSDSLSGGLFAYTNANAGIGNKTVTVGGVTVNDGNSGGNYAVTYANNTTSTINKAALTLSTPDVVKTYDGTTNATAAQGAQALITSGQLYGTDSLSGGLFAYTNANAGNGNKTVTVGGVTLNDGNNGGNYTVTYANNTTSTINPAAVTVSILDLVKTYDGTTSASGATATVTSGQLFGSDSLNGGLFAYTNANAGMNNKTVTVGGVTVNDGNSGGNYIVSYANNTTSTINKAALTVSTANVVKTYDATTSAGGASATVTSGQLFGTDSLSGGLFAYTNANAGIGNKTVTVGGVTVNDGNSGGNYAVTYANNTTSTINKAALTLSTPDVVKTYDGTTNATAAQGAQALITSGQLFGSDSLSGGLFAFTNANAGIGNKTVTVNGVTVNDGNNGSNYAVTYASNTTSTINKAALTVTANNDGKLVTTADDTGYQGVSFTGFAAGENAGNLTGTATVTRTGEGTQEMAGSYTGVLVPGGVSSGNYSISYVNGNYTIVPADELLIKVNKNSPLLYGLSPVYTTSDLSVAYLDSNGNTVKALSGTAAGGNTFTYSDGAGGSVTFTLTPAGGVYSSGNYLNVGNYALSGTSIAQNGSNFSGGPVFSGNLTVNPLGITANASTVSKVYDGTTAMNGVTLGLPGVLSGDAVTVSGTGAFSQKNVGSNLSYTISDLLLNGIDAANYFLTQGGSFTGNNGQITPASLIIGAANIVKTYDATTSAPNGQAIVRGGQLYGTDSLSGGQFAYNNANAGIGNKTVTVGGVTVNDDNNGDNYIVSYVDNTTSTINKAALTIGTANVVKTYDSTTDVNGASATVTGGQLFGSDSLSGGQFAYTNANAGIGNKTVTVSGVTVNDGNNGGNYTVTYTDNTTSTINKAALTLSTPDVVKTYDGTTSVSGATATVTNGQLFGTDSLSGGLFAYINANAGSGNKTVTVGGVSVNDGNSGGNYDVTYADNTTSTINKAALTLSTPDAVKTYDGTTAVNGGQAIVTSGQLYGSDSLSGGLFAYTNANAGVGNKTVTVGGVTVNDGNSGGNYAVTYANNMTSTINKAALTISTPDVVKTYDGTTNANGAQAAITVGQLFGTDSLSGGVFAYTNANAGIGNKTVTVGGVSVNDGNNGGNYVVTYANNTTSTINKAALTVSTSDVVKTYDGTTSANGAQAAIAGGQLFGSDSLSGGQFAYTNANAGIGNKTVTVNGVSVNDGNSGGNYAVTYVNNTTSTINKAALTISILDLVKTYDGTTSASGAKATVTNGQLYGSDNLSGGQFAYTNANAGTGNKTVTVGGVAVNDGNSGGNYDVTYADNTTSTINKAALTVSTPDVVKTYDGTTSASGANATVTSGQLFGTDNLSGGVFAYTNANAGVGNKTVTVGGVTVNDGNSGGNYAVTYANNTTSTINKAALTVSTSDVVKTYDGTTSANGAQAAIAGGQLFGSDSLSGGQFAYTNANAGIGNKTVTVNGVSVNDGNSGGNYAVTYVNNTTSTINKAALTISILDLVKTYDGTTSASGAKAAVTSGQLYGSDNLSGGQFAYTNANAGIGTKTVTVDGVAVNDGNSGGNYVVTYADNTSSTINKANLIVTANSDSKYVTASDAPGYKGVSYGGFVANESANVLSGMLTLTRAGKGIQEAPGTYQGVLVPGGLSSANYTLTYVKGNYTITPAGSVAIKIAPPASGVVYGTTPAFNPGDMTVQYLDNNGNVISTLSGTNEGNNRFTFSDGAGGSLSFTLGLDDTSFSTGHHLNVGSYDLAGLDVVTTGGSFTGNPDFAGVLNVTPKGVAVDTSAISKVYDGTVLLNGSMLKLLGLLSDDLVNVQGSGVFAQKNVGSHLKYILNNLALAGVDAKNYTLLSGRTLTGNNGTITPASLVISTSNVIKTYDGKILAPGAQAIILDGKLYGSDSLSGGVFHYTNPKVGIGNKVVVVKNVTVNDGNNGSNYLVSYVNNVTSTINKAPLTVTRDGDGHLVLTGLIPGDTVQVTNNNGGISLGGVSSGNYLLVDQTGGGTDGPVDYSQINGGTQEKATLPRTNEEMANKAIGPNKVRLTTSELKLDAKEASRWPYPANSMVTPDIYFIGR